MAPRTPVVLFIENDITCPPALVGEWLEEDGFQIQVIAAATGEEVPSRVPAGVDAVCALGGDIGANDEDIAPWLSAEKSLLRDAVEQGVPVLGLCLGGQLLASATGGHVEVSDVTEIGVSEVLRTIDGLADPVISATVPQRGDTVPVAQWHLDHIRRMPDGAVLLMTNEACRVQAFRLGETAYGLQMHPEVDVAIYESWVDGADEVVPRTSTTASQSLADVRERAGELVAAWRPAIRAWGDLVWTRARTLSTLEP